MSDSHSRWLEQLEKTTRRFNASSDERKRVAKQLKRGDIASANRFDKEFLRKRLSRAGVDEQLANELANPKSIKRTRAIVDACHPEDSKSMLLERVIGQKDLMSVNFLTEGALVSQAVGRIQFPERNGAGTVFGTAFMVSSRLLITNNHVLENIDDAKVASIEFNYERAPDDTLERPVSFRLDPGSLFITNKQLDYTLVAVLAIGQNGQSLSDFGYRSMKDLSAAVGNGDRVNIIQHPNGEPKQIAVRQNKVTTVLIDSGFVHYTADTAPGSSGSPVFDDRWEVVALHHSGVPKRNDAGQILAVDGSVWETDMGTHRVKWIANEGVLISAILSDIKSRQDNLSENEKALIAELFSNSDSSRRVSNSPATNSAVPEDSRQDTPTATVVDSGPSKNRTGNDSFTDSSKQVEIQIPLNIVIRNGQASIASIGPTAASGETSDANSTSSPGESPAGSTKPFDRSHSDEHDRLIRYGD